MMLSFLAAIVMIAAQPAHGAMLSELRWQNRVLLLFAADAGDPALRQQRDELLSDQGALAERDLAVFAVVGDDVEPVFGATPLGDTAAGLRERFAVDVDAQFNAVLVGLDGGVKWRSNCPIRLADVNAVINAMPMRRSAR